MLGEIQSFTVEKQYVRKDGSLCWARVKALHIKPDQNGIARTLALIEDINEEVARRAWQFLPLTSSPFQLSENYLKDNWDKKLDVVILAGIAGISERSYFERFKAAFGLTPAVYLKRLRLHHARCMLQDNKPGRSVSGVAYLCAFNNLGHFARDYRTTFGENPSATLASARFQLDAVAPVH